MDLGRRCLCLELFLCWFSVGGGGCGSRHDEKTLTWLNLPLGGWRGDVDHGSSSGGGGRGGGCSSVLGQHGRR